MFKNHPRGLVTVFMTEIWERFSYYGMRALLIMYMTKHLIFADEKAYGVYGAYTALVYATPLLGGYLADKILGPRKAVLMGAFIMMLGHFTMAVESLFYPALALLVVGNGLFKPNMGPILGRLYGENDPRRDGGFTIFYTAVNIGAWISPLACGYVGEVYGWHYGFGLAGVGMAIGFVIFQRNQKIFGDMGLAPESSLKPFFLGLNKIHLTFIGALLIVPLFMLLLNQNAWMSSLLGIAGVIVLVVVGYTAVKSGQVERDRLIVAMVLTVYSVLFWSFFFQGGSSLTLFADRNIDRNLFGWTVKASMLESVNPMFIILLSGPFSAMWVRLSKINKEPSTPMKFVWGTLLLGVGFGIFALGRMFAVNGLIPFAFLILGYLVYTMGELSISPVGLSMITKLSPDKIVGFMMGVWFLSAAFANHIAAFIAKFTSSGGAGVTDAVSSMNAYTSVYMDVFWISIGASMIMLLLLKPLRKMMHGIH
ncbi:MAG TPA: MFS transporter [Caldithrix abyssi]|uniref:MFS transporter n=1 Tax=Caldithrix abyssi TaxID=187145 RepID=A0A7V1PTV8_CALAY|nr:MFS transporter [Caldithrix abyssi]